jgi:protein-tyrosine phosphatase
VSFQLVFVCTGNRFRSPLAAAVFRRETEGLPIEVASAGTLELGPVPALPEAIVEAERLGLGLADHRADSLAEVGPSDADLVVGFERMHVVTAVVDGGARRERTFTLPELVALLGRIEPPDADDPLERARLALELAHAHRPPDSTLASVPELEDPLGRSAEHQRELAERVSALTTQLARLLFGR